jgi:amidase
MPSSSSPTSSSSWESISATRRALVQDAIPPQWRLPQGTPPEGQTNVLDIPETCGVLSPEQLEITSLTATELVLKLARGSLSSVTVTEAFCMRAAIAHQLVNCLTDFFPREALTRAAELDHILASELCVSLCRFRARFLVHACNILDSRT